MQAEYERNWGYKEAEKRAEIFAPEARYLVVLAADEEGPEDEEPPSGAEASSAASSAGGGGGGQEQPEQGQQQGQKEKCPVLGFVHLRYVLDEEDEAKEDAAVLYIYEVRSFVNSLRRTPRGPPVTHRPHTPDPRSSSPRACSGAGSARGSWRWASGWRAGWGCARRS